MDWRGTLNFVMLQNLMTTAMGLFSYALVIAAVWKLFQIGTDLAEIKKLLTDTRTVANPAPIPPPKPVAISPLPAGPISLESAEALLREVAAESHSLEHNKPSV